MSDDLSPKERLLRKLNKQTTDRPPVICPGGMMNAAIAGVMERTGHSLPEGHGDAGTMAALARGVAELTGFENYGAPFCMTIEAEALGSEVDLGSISCEPKIKAERYKSLADVALPLRRARPEGRVAAVAGALGALSGGDIPVIGSVTGPISASAALVDPMTFLKRLRRERENAHRVIDAVTDWLISYSLILIEGGADVISIADPTATGEILGPKLFEEYALAYINKLADAIRRAGRAVIVHICGNLGAVSGLVPGLRGDALSVDAMVSLKAMKREHLGIGTMGNLSTILLQDAGPALIAARAEALLRDGVDIIAPACGLSVTTPLENVQAFTSAAKERAYGTAAP
jgi:[methyl-Co(III) methanol-specific corrinoid protein]:coenzyme M methyltransferase